MSDKDEDTETEEHRDLDEYHCVLETEERTSATVGEVTEVVFDPEVLSDWVYRELLDATRADGYELVGFGAALVDTEDGEVPAPKASFVYRGVPEE